MQNKRVYDALTVRPKYTTPQSRYLTASVAIWVKEKRTDKPARQGMLLKVNNCVRLNVLL